MLPSRALRLFPHGPSKSFGRRQFSSSFTKPTKSRLSNSTISLAKSNIRPRILNTASVVLLSGRILRFQSTVPSSPPGPAAAAPPLASPTPQSEFIPEPVTSAFEAPGLLDVPETFSYLKSLGLDFGWGPTAMVEWILANIHVLAGTPWWASISITAVLIRLALYKLFEEGANNGAKMQKIRPMTDPINQRMQAAMLAGDAQTSTIAKQQIAAINRKAGVNPFISAGPPLLQAFIGYGTFKLMRNMGALPVPGWESGGVLWFTNLALPDPIYLLPLGASAVLFFNLRRSSEIGTTGLMNPSTMRTISIVLPLVSMLFLSFLPAGLQLSFFISGFMTSAQGWLFAKDKFRAWRGMEPIPPDHGPSSLLTSLLPNASSSTTLKTPQVQRRVILASRSLTQSPFKYEAPSPRSGYAGDETEGKKGPAKKSILNSLKGGFHSRLSDITATAKSVQDRFGTKPEDMEKKEAERYEKIRKDELEAEKLKRIRGKRRERNFR